MDISLKSRYLKDFIKEITYNNRNPRDLKALEFLDDISTNPERTVFAGTKLYRCRIIKDGNSINATAPFYGFNAEDSFVPPKKATRDLRANYRYIPYLYSSNNPYIALTEVRPRLGSSVSISTISVNEDLRFLDFTSADKPSKMTDAKVNLFSDLSALYSKPVTDDDDIIDYIPTQYIAEYAKNLGYDGIIFKSSLVPEINEANLDRYNVVVFNFDKCQVIKSNVLAVSGCYFDCEKIDSDSEDLKIESYIYELLNW